VGLEDRRLPRAYSCRQHVRPVSRALPAASPFMDHFLPPLLPAVVTAHGCGRAHYTYSCLPTTSRRLPASHQPSAWTTTVTPVTYISTAPPTYLLPARVGVPNLWVHSVIGGRSWYDAALAANKARGDRTTGGVARRRILSRISRATITQRQRYRAGRTVRVAIMHRCFSLRASGLPAANAGNDISLLCVFCLDLCMAILPGCLYL